MIIQGDALTVLKAMQDGSVNCCVTSPPYWNLRDYQVEGQLGMEPTPDEYVQNLVDVFREVKRALRDDGTLFLNLGDSYSGGGRGSGYSKKQDSNRGTVDMPRSIIASGLKPKDLVGIPWMVAFALRADGWYLRQEIIWSKPNPMPESVKDRCTKSHESIFLLSKSPKYYFDAEAIAEPAKYESAKRYEYGFGGQKSIELSESGFGATRPIGNRTLRKNDNTTHGGNGTGFQNHSGYNQLDNPYIRNKRDVWVVSTQPFKDAHFATFPPELIRPCVLAGCPKGGIVLDPFFGAGTTGLVALQEQRDYIGIELNADYIKIAEKRLSGVQIKL